MTRVCARLDKTEREGTDIGYTHYWRPTKGIEPTTFARLSAAAAKVVSIAWDEQEIDFADGLGDEGTEPEFTKELIRFNGLGDNSHETFYLSPEPQGFQFCKTAMKPYDVAVTAILCLLHLYTDGTVEISSDGDKRDWEAGLELARRVAPDAQIPPSV